MRLKWLAKPRVLKKTKELISAVSYQLHMQQLIVRKFNSLGPGQNLFNLKDRSEAPVCQLTDFSSVDALHIYQDSSLVG